jgi:hypothetical protein
MDIVHGLTDHRCAMGAFSKKPGVATLVGPGYMTLLIAAAIWWSEKEKSGVSHIDQDCRYTRARHINRWIAGN